MLGGAKLIYCLALHGKNPDAGRVLFAKNGCMRAVIYFILSYGQIYNIFLKIHPRVCGFPIWIWYRIRSQCNDLIATISHFIESLSSIVKVAVHMMASFW